MYKRQSLGELIVGAGTSFLGDFEVDSFLTLLAEFFASVPLLFLSFSFSVALVEDGTLFSFLTVLSLELVFGSFLIADAVLFEMGFFLLESALLLEAFFDVLLTGFGNIADTEFDFLALSGAGFLLGLPLESLCVIELLLRFKETFSVGCLVKAGFRE